jgi:predicted SAM-dependent methyltransferase
MGAVSSQPTVTSAGARGKTLQFLMQIQRRIGRFFRRRRHKWLAEEFAECKTVIDIGGRELMWQTVPFSPHVTIVNPEAVTITRPGFRYVQGNGCRLDFADGSFDMAFANSVIEHLGTPENQKIFAQEMMRVGRRLYCQTPNRWFPLEFHYWGLFFHWFPKKWLTYGVHRYLTVKGLLGNPTREQWMEWQNEIRLLSRKEFAALFPGCKIKTERLLGWPKSYIAWR